MSQPLHQKQKCILHIDYDSFFASVEQQANPFLRGKPIAITGSSVEKGVVCTASKEAKKLGIKTGMPVFKARQLCPNLIVLTGDFAKYHYVHTESLKIFNKYTDLVEPFSIDEAFLDVTSTLKYFKSPTDVADRIKNNILKKFGSYITCSIGVGPNKLLAKLVSDINKPNGLFIVNDQNINTVLKNSKLKDFCGIGYQTEKHLNKLGIFTVTDLQKSPNHLLQQNFGNVTGSFLKNTSLGLDYSPVAEANTYNTPKSISHQHTLHQNTKDIKVVRANLQNLCYMVLKRLRNHNMVAKKLHFYISDTNNNYYSQNIKLYNYTDSSSQVFDELKKALDQMCQNEPIKKSTYRFISFGVSNLIKKDKAPIFLFDNLPESTIPAQNTTLTTLLDKINNKWGENTIAPANTLLTDNKKASNLSKH